MLPEDAMYDNMLETLAYIRFRHPRRCSRRQAHDEIEQLIPLPIVAIYCPQSEIHFKSCGDSSRKWQAKRHSSLQIGLGLPSKWIEWEDLDFHIFSTSLLTTSSKTQRSQPACATVQGARGLPRARVDSFPSYSFLLSSFSSFPLFLFSEEPVLPVLLTFPIILRATSSTSSSLAVRLPHHTCLFTRFDRPSSHIVERVITVR